MRLRCVGGDCTNREFSLNLVSRIFCFLVSTFISVFCVFSLILFLIQVAYTYDAGPNAVLYVESKNIPEVLSLIKYYFPPTNGQSK